MLMFTFHIAFALGLMALTFGLFLKKCSKCCCNKSGSSCETSCQNGAGKCKLTCCCGIIIIILALLSLICTGHAGYCYYKAGAFKMPAVMEATSTTETIDMHMKQ